jgi:hypothetical protein
MEDLEEFVHRQNLTIFRRQLDLPKKTSDGNGS